MSDVIHSIFGIRETKNTLVRPERQSMEQTEDYAIKQAIHVQEIYVTKLILDKASNTYFQYNSSSGELELYVNGSIIASW